MEKTQFKEGILKEGLKKHETVIEDFRQRIKDILATEGNVNEEEYDSHVQSQKAETVAEVNLLSDQLQFAIHELEELQELEWYIDQPHATVEFGTVVVTDRSTFFVSTSLEEFFVEGKSIFGVSVHSPIYKSMKGKKVGESFTHGSTNYLIKEVF